MLAKKVEKLVILLTEPTTGQMYYNLSMKKLFALAGISLLLLVLAVTPILARAPSGEIPEEDGTYDDPGHPGVKVRVFVYRERPTTATSSSLVCSSDPDSLAVVAATGWKLSPNWTYNLNLSSAPTSVGSANLATFAGYGFNNWKSASGNKVNFTRGSDTTMSRSAYDGLNVVAWGRTNGSALAVTYTRYYTSTGQVVDVDTIMNKKFVWSWTNQSTNPQCAASNTYDAQDILTHELGHWLGLDDEYTSAYVDNTMYGYGSKAEIKKDTLTTGDKNGTFAIYNP